MSSYINNQPSDKNITCPPPPPPKKNLPKIIRILITKQLVCLFIFTTSLWKQNNTCVELHVLQCVRKEVFPFTSTCVFYSRPNTTVWQSTEHVIDSILLLSWYSQKGSSSNWANNRLKFTTVYAKLELILGSTWAWSLLWVQSHLWCLWCPYVFPLFSIGPLSHMEIYVPLWQPHMFDLNCLSQARDKQYLNHLSCVYNTLITGSDITPYVRLGTHKFN